MYFVKMGSLIGVTGLILDIIGAWYISKGLVRKTLAGIVQEAPKFSYGVNVAYVIGALRQKNEATIGFWILTIGFTAQVISYLLWIELSSLNISLWWIALDLFAFGTVFKVSDLIVIGRNKTVTKNYLREKILEHMKSSEKPEAINVTKQYLEHLYVKFDENITIEDAWPKLLKELGISQRSTTP